jgi:hypothetical protein
MKVTSKHTLAVAAIAGLLAGTSATYAASSAADHQAGIKVSTMGDKDSSSCKGKTSCKGQNSCKGQGGCKSSDNGCKGKNSCKGKGGCGAAK